MEINNLIRFTANGLDVAEHYQVREVISNMFKEAYGKDIDLSTDNADGVYVENLSLIITNILQTVKILNKNLDIDSASGSYLDTLCALSGIYRKSATRSKMRVTIKNNADSDLVISYNSPTFVDSNGVLWHYDGTITNPELDNITIEAGATSTIPLICDDYGQVEVNGDLKIVDDSVDATITLNLFTLTVGETIESDAKLRSRRSEIINGNSTTVIEGLKSALLNLGNIDEVKIYNNVINSSGLSALDGTSVAYHNQYIIIRTPYSEDAALLDSNLIGKLIYSKMTPGVLTTAASSSIGGKSASVDLGFGGHSVTVYWKQCMPILDDDYSEDKIEISITPQNNFDEASASEAIKKGLSNYLNSLNLDEKFSTFDLYEMINSFDPLYEGKRTFSVSNISNLDGIANKLSKSALQTGGFYNYQLLDTYFNITELSIDIVLPE